ncbi:MAG: hypothetical protein QW261_13955 [Candidatus Jordarchaeaceae archaeon]
MARFKKRRGLSGEGISGSPELAAILEALNREGLLSEVSFLDKNNLIIHISSSRGIPAIFKKYEKRIISADELCDDCIYECYGNCCPIAQKSKFVTRCKYYTSTE